MAVRRRWGGKKGAGRARVHVSEVTEAVRTVVPDACSPKRQLRSCAALQLPEMLVAAELV